MIRANAGRLATVTVAVLVTLNAHLGTFTWLPLGVQHLIEISAFIASVTSALWVNPSATIDDGTTMSPTYLHRRP